jgi:hypothetical protein
MTGTRAAGRGQISETPAPFGGRVRAADGGGRAPLARHASCTPGRLMRAAAPMMVLLLASAACSSSSAIALGADSGAGGEGGRAGQSGTDAGDPGSADAADADGPGTSDAGSACQMIATLDRSCTAEADCVAVRHVSNCCGQQTFIGIRASESARFQSLEATCDSTYPVCRCGVGPPTADDGSALAFAGAQPGVTCLRGRCTTFASACGHVCESGTSCFTCSDHVRDYAACSSRCNSATECKDPTLSTCQDSPTGKFCAAASASCNTR